MRSASYVSIRNSMYQYVSIVMCRESGDSLLYDVTFMSEMHSLHKDRMRFKEHKMRSGWTGSKLWVAKTPAAHVLRSNVRANSSRNPNATLSLVVENEWNVP